MFEVEKDFKLNLAGKDIFVKTGKYCGQSNGTCQVRCGDKIGRASCRERVSLCV